MSHQAAFQQEHNINDDQLESMLFLSTLGSDTPTAQANAETTSIITTHCAHIVLTHDRAYKIKRSVEYSYINMLSLQSREKLCKRELQLNKPSLPSIYREVVPVTKSVDGCLSLGNSGEVKGEIVEWVLVMNRFSQHRVLDTMAENGSLSIEIAKQVGNSIARYHKNSAARITRDGYERMNEIVNELADELSNQAPGFDKALLDVFIKKGKAVVNEHETLLDQRASQGYIKRCHGDLHLRNLVLMGDGPHPFDALEFDERLATIDVLYDLAFVLMDMSHRGLNDQQNTLLNQYLAHCDPVDLEGLALLPLFLFCRAGIKAMTTAQNVGTNQTTQNPEAIDYLHLALTYLDPKPTALIAIGGYSGSGKSTIAARIAIMQNAILLSSDIERKAQLQVAETQPLPDSAYTAKSAQLNYQRLIEKAQIAMSANQTVVVDATFLASEQRRHIETLIETPGKPFIGIWLDVPTEILESRIRKRSSNASDATVEVLRKQLKDPVKDMNWHKINASDSLDATMERIAKLLQPIHINKSSQLKNSSQQPHHT